MVKYVYDAWGNHKALDSDGNIVTSGIGLLNPFRYRGYYYDTEIKLYYLQTRYYDPELGRFISQDSIEYADPETVNGINLYAYCGNNPVMNIDPTGTIVLTTAMIIGLIIGAVVGAAVGGYVAGSIASEKGASGGELVGWIMLGVFGGAIIGGAIGTFAGWAAPSIGSFLGTSFKLGSFVLASGQTITVSITGGQAVAGVLGLLVLLAKINKHGEPNSIVGNGTSEGIYDNNGNLIYRRDYTGRPHFDKVSKINVPTPHTHGYIWEFVKGAWHIVRDFILPF